MGFRDMYQSIIHTERFIFTSTKEKKVVCPKQPVRGCFHFLTAVWLLWAAQLKEHQLLNYFAPFGFICSRQ